MLFKNIVGRLVKKKRIASASLRPLPWDEVIKACYDKELSYSDSVIGVVYTDDKAERAVILQREDKLYTVFFEKLFLYDADELQYMSADLPGYWERRDANNSIFDSKKSTENYIFSEPPFKYNKHRG